MKTIELGNGSYFVGEEFSVGKNFEVGSRTTIRATNFVAGDHVSIGSDNEFLVEEFLYIGSCGHIGNQNSFTAREIRFGDYLYLDSQVVVGLGGCYTQDSILLVGNGVMVCSRAKLNPNYMIQIGNGVGIGEYVDIWTHGSYPPILDGFPAQFGPVSIGDNVWLPTKTIVMPNVDIGSNVVVAAMSVVNKNLPTGCLAGGVPARVIKANVYPNHDSVANDDKVCEIIYEYERLAEYKKLDVHIEFVQNAGAVYMNGRRFDFVRMTVDGPLDIVQEDFRDFMRRRGIKFFTGLPFRSIMPEKFMKLKSVVCQ
jgi:acyl-[acyl carrier protein]--UDP-N-acetylglucosamine O-acyltransferase